MYEKVKSIDMPGHTFITLFRRVRGFLIKGKSIAPTPILFIFYIRALPFCKKVKKYGIPPAARCKKVSALL